MSNDVICKPIGSIKTCFKHKNGTPRQSAIAPTSQGIITVDKSVFNNPEHSLEGLLEYSHVWILFHFHLNKGACKKAKVKPPRMDGKRIGVFASRSMHRPNPIGLTLAKLDKIVHSTIYVSGIDIVDGTPILDIKPYITTYDNPGNFVKAKTENISNEMNSKPFDGESRIIQAIDCEVPCKKQRSTEMCSTQEQFLHSDISVQLSTVTSVPKWIDSTNQVEVLFTERSLKNINSSSNICDLIRDVLSADPRSVYRRNKCNDRLYFLTLSGFHITVWFDDGNIAEVLKIVPDT